MIKLFLAEDETVMREGIKKHIDWEKEGIEFAGEAGDGEIAYPMILNLKPDILITDIKMPFMDGLQLIELVKKELPDLHVIILSGYDDFSYAQKAITLGASEYLLKPISPSKLLETVRKVAAAIQAEHPKGQTDWTQEELEEKEELSKNRLFNAMIMTTGSVPELIASGKELGIDLTMLYSGSCFWISESRAKSAMLFPKQGMPSG
ncbi:MAG: response regulator [Lachnospiraceae bacterium]|jgi:two-component system response regulator YesN|nr:response regulator [Lachnospiraceae bacterium]